MPLFDTIPTTRTRSRHSPTGTGEHYGLSDPLQDPLLQQQLSDDIDDDMDVMIGLGDKYPDMVPLRQTQVVDDDDDMDVMIGLGDKYPDMVPLSQTQVVDDDDDMDVMFDLLSNDPLSHGLVPKQEILSKLMDHKKSSKLDDDKTLSINNKRSLKPPPTKPNRLKKDRWKTEWVDFTSNGTLFVDQPTPDDVVQSNINDCYFMATIASTAQSHPDYIHKMIKEDAPGSYRVRLYKRQDDESVKPEWFTVTADLPSRDGMPYYAYSENKKNGKIELWPSILEKAYAQLKGSYTSIDWGDTKYAYQAVFGTEGEKVETTKTSSDEEWQRLTEALDGGEPVVASTSRHVVSVLEYMDLGDQKLVRVRDQAKSTGLTGKKNKTGAKDRDELMTFGDLRARYAYIRYANPPEAPEQSSENKG